MTNKCKKGVKIAEKLKDFCSMVEQQHPLYESIVHIFSALMMKQNPNVKIVVSIGKKETNTCFISYITSTIESPMVYLVFPEANYPQILIKNRGNDVVLNLKEMNNISICTDKISDTWCKHTIDFNCVDNQLDYHIEVIEK